MRASGRRRRGVRARGERRRGGARSSSAGPDGRPFVNLASAGALARPPPSTRMGSRERLGALAYPLGALRAGADRHARSAAWSMRRRARSSTGEAWQVSVACTGAFGGGASLETDACDGRLDVVVIEGAAAAGSSSTPTGCAAAGSSDREGVRDRRCDRVDLRLDEDEMPERGRRADRRRASCRGRRHPLRREADALRADRRLSRRRALSSRRRGPTSAHSSRPVARNAARALGAVRLRARSGRRSPVGRALQAIGRADQRLLRGAPHPRPQPRWRTESSRGSASSASSAPDGPRSALAGALARPERRARLLAPPAAAPAAILANYSVKLTIGRERPLIDEHPPLARAPEQALLPLRPLDLLGRRARSSLGRVAPAARPAALRRWRRRSASAAPTSACTTPPT